MSWPESYATKWPTNHERPTGPLALLERVLANLPAMPDAACVGRADLFDADTLDRAADAAKALAICDACPALSQCERFTASQPRSRLCGVWAGSWYLAGHNDTDKGSQP